MIIFRLRAGFDVTDLVPHRKGRHKAGTCERVYIFLSTAEESAHQLLEGDGTPPDSRADSVRPLINPTPSSSRMAHELTEIPLHTESPALPRTERHQLSLSSLRNYQRITREDEDEEVKLDDSILTVNSYTQAMEQGIDEYVYLT